MCGEKPLRSSATRFGTGSPPRVRGKALQTRCGGVLGGITPACAGKSWTVSAYKDAYRDHPRVCGEKTLPGVVNKLSQGSPPRVRGKVPSRRSRKTKSGITPACAGKRAFFFRHNLLFWDHPRVCGEKLMYAALLKYRRGSPPRVRGKGKNAYRPERTTGITPACAGKSPVLISLMVIRRDHPRVCGEKERTSRCSCWTEGSPPRVRGKDFWHYADVYSTGITPACAGKSLTIQKMTTRSRDHPRVCGEKRFFLRSALR